MSHAMHEVPPAVTDIDALKDKRALAILLEWDRSAVLAAKWDRNELTVDIARERIREACSVLQVEFNFLSDVTSYDSFPVEPRFHIVYNLLSHKLKERVRLKVNLNSDSASIESITSVWAGANLFEREIFDLMGVRFLSHPNLKRLLMPDDWEGHPLRKDYPVEGYR